LDQITEFWSPAALVASLRIVLCFQASDARQPSTVSTGGSPWLAYIGKEAALMPVLGMKHGVFLPLKLCLFSGEAEEVYVVALPMRLLPPDAQWERATQQTNR
jgi:hypothetical protein